MASRARPCALKDFKVFAFSAPFRGWTEQYKQSLCGHHEPESCEANPLNDNVCNRMRPDGEGAMRESRATHTRLPYALFTSMINSEGKSRKGICAAAPRHQQPTKTKVALAKRVMATLSLSTTCTLSLPSCPPACTQTITARRSTSYRTTETPRNTKHWLLPQLGPARANYANTGGFSFNS